jgi:hypothetical protein
VIDPTGSNSTHGNAELADYSRKIEFAGCRRECRQTGQAEKARGERGTAPALAA